MIAKDGTLGTPIRGVPEVDDGRPGRAARRGAGANDYLPIAAAFTSRIRSRARTERTAPVVARAKLVLDWRQRQARRPDGHLSPGAGLQAATSISDRASSFAGEGTLFVTVGERTMAQDQGRVAEPHQHHRQDDLHHGLTARPRRRQSEAQEGWDPKVWSHRPPQRAGRGDRSGDRQALDARARPAGRRRTQPAGSRQELRLAGHHLRQRVLGRGRSAKGISSKPGLEQPVYYWNPSIATSSLACSIRAISSRVEGQLPRSVRSSSCRCSGS